ncbi:efflux RND transporter periplasmic adaptor subunit [Variovorax sp. J22R133]|uniref:efflux RND transporter periplasmic adaptor subunit n=1 Tax=Variovorax brevis TaxID=3053503 RepID=UPI0025785274|nr:efflux RND transporter periplasmic adaptor subunit [Variovorax sp. J22R133]MDM0111893.1 efflux RND transporter periplasmic adaptor subunit [Variovorax sp. J22R133]
MKRWIPWTVAVVAVAVVAGGALRAVKARKAQQVVATAPAEMPVTLLPADVLRAESRDMAQTLPVSGTLRAVDWAVVKARVAGELSGLTVREGDPVRAGQVIARIDSAEYESRVRQAQEQADSARAQADVAQRNYDNNKALVDQGFISRTALETSQSNLNSARATHRAALAGVEVARKALNDTVLRSPIDGQVAARLAQPGERMAIDGKVIEVVDLSHVEVEATLSAADSVAVRVGQRASLEIEGSGTADPQKSQRQVGATVVRVNPSAQAGSRSVLVYLRLDRNEGLRQGLFAQGSIEIGRTKAIALPLSAVRVDKPAPYVQVIVEGRVVHRPVQTGQRGKVDGQPFVSVTGIDDGAMVVAGTIGQLREGTPVRLATAPNASAVASSATRSTP